MNTLQMLQSITNPISIIPIFQNILQSIRITTYDRLFASSLLAMTSVALAIDRSSNSTTARSESMKVIRVSF